MVAVWPGWMAPRNLPFSVETFRVAAPQPGDHPGAICEDLPHASRVLIVDDEPIIRESVARQLQVAGFCPVPAAGAEEAIHLLAQAPDSFRLAVIDLSLPGLDGTVLADALKRLAPAVPLILMSGADVLSVQTSGAQVRFAAFLQKPFSFPELLGAVLRALQTK